MTHQIEALNLLCNMHAWSLLCVHTNSTMLCAIMFQLSFSRYAFLSDYLTDLLHWEEQKKIFKNCPQWGLNPQPLDQHSNALLTVLAWYVLSRRFLK